MSYQPIYQSFLLLQAICQMLNQFFLPSFQNQSSQASNCFPNTTSPSKMSQNHIFIDLVSHQETGSEVAPNQLSQRISKADRDECSPFQFDLSEHERQKKASLPNQKKIKKRCKGFQNGKNCGPKRSRKLKTCFIALKPSKSQQEDSFKRQCSMKSQITYPGSISNISIPYESKEPIPLQQISTSPQKKATNFRQTKAAKLSQGGLVRETQQVYKNQDFHKNVFHPFQQRVTRNRVKANSYNELSISQNEQDEEIRARYQVAKYRYRLTSTAFAIDQLASVCTERLSSVPNRATVAFEPTIPLNSSKYSILTACLKLQLRKRKFIDIVE